MKRVFFLIICIGIFSLNNFAQEHNSNDDVYEKYLLEQEILNQSFSKFFYGNFVKNYSLDEEEFVNVIDSL